MCHSLPGLINRIYTENPWPVALWSDAVEANPEDTAAASFQQGFARAQRTKLLSQERTLDDHARQQRQASESRAGFADAHMCCREIAAGACKGLGPGENARQTRGGGVSRELQSGD